jgi:hypothetical protein
VRDALPEIDDDVPEVRGVVRLENGKNVGAEALLAFDDGVVRGIGGERGVVVRRREADELFGSARLVAADHRHCGHGIPKEKAPAKARGLGGGRVHRSGMKKPAGREAAGGDACREWVFYLCLRLSASGERAQFGLLL